MFSKKKKKTDFYKRISVKKKKNIKLYIYNACLKYEK